MTKRTAYEDMVAALEASGWEWPMGEWHQPTCTRRSSWEWLRNQKLSDENDTECSSACAKAQAALTKAKKVPVEVGMFGTGSQEDVIYQRIFMSGKTRAEDVEVVKSATKGHPPNHTCWACACLRELESREAL